MSEMQAYVERQLKKQRDLVMAGSDQLTLGQIIDKCESINDKTADVVFDFEYFHPTGLDSWRGIYEELALSFDGAGEPMSLESFISLLNDADGKTFEGYKGGNYTMNKSTPVWVANYGNSANTAVTGVFDAGYRVVIMTAYRES